MTETETWIDGWSGSFDWRDQIHEGHCSPEDLLGELQALASGYPDETPPPSDWDEVLSILSSYCCK